MFLVVPFHVFSYPAHSYRYILKCFDVFLDRNLSKVVSFLFVLKFNAGKCVVGKIRDKLKCTYTQSGVCLHQAKERRDKRILVCSDLPTWSRISRIVKQASQYKTVIFYQSNFQKGKNLPVLEYVAVIWSSNYKIDIDSLQSAPERVSSFAKEDIKPPSLESKWQFSNLCQVYKILIGALKVTKLFTFSNIW